MSIKVSIVIPTYKRIDKLNRLLRSISNGDLDKIEVIIVNDDPEFKYSEKFFKDFINTDSFIIINNEKNMGLNLSRYIGGLQSSGKYIFFVDDDNIFAENTVSALYYDFEELPNTVAVLAPIAYYYSNTNRVWWCGTRFGKYTLKSSFIKPCNGRYIETDDVHNAFIIKRKYLDYMRITAQYFKRTFSSYAFVTILRKRGLRALVDTSAKIFHDAPYNTNEDREVKLHELIESRFDEDRIFHYFYEPLIYSKLFSESYVNILLNVFFQFLRLQIYSLAGIRSNLTLSRKRRLILSSYKGFMKGVITKIPDKELS